MSKVFEVERELKALKVAHKAIGEDISSNYMDLANYIITKCTVDNNPLTNHELQLIMYILQREALIYAASPIHDGRFEAWDQGPVIPEIYHHFLPTGFIRSYCTRDVVIKGQRYIDSVVVKAKSLKPQELEHEVRKVGGAWHTIRQKNDETLIQIPLFLIRRNG